MHCLEMLFSDINIAIVAYFYTRMICFYFPTLIDSEYLFFWETEFSKKKFSLNMSTT